MTATPRCTPRPITDCERPGDEYVAATINAGLLKDATLNFNQFSVAEQDEWLNTETGTAMPNRIVRLTLEARLEWRLSGKTPKITSPDDPRIAEVVLRRRWGDGKFWRSLKDLNGRTD